MSEEVTMNLAQQKLDRNFEWCCMFKKKKLNLLKLLSCIGMKDLGRVRLCQEMLFLSQTLAGYSMYKKCIFFLNS